MHMSSAVKPSHLYHHRTHTRLPDDDARTVTLLGCLKAYADSSRIKCLFVDKCPCHCRLGSKVLRPSEVVHLPVTVWLKRSISLVGDIVSRPRHHRASLGLS